MKKVLILVPGNNARGGITNYYSSIKKHLPKEIEYLERGSRNWPRKDSNIKSVFRFFRDYFGFVFLIIVHRISIVQTTTAFYRASIIRDGLYIILSKLLNRKTVVFFRGWDNNFVFNISGFYKFWVKQIYFRVDAIIDLSEGNVKQLKKMGYKGKIYQETTLVDTLLVENLDIEELISQRMMNSQKTILFLSRIEKAKGIYQLLDTFKQLQSENGHFKLIFAGDGNELENLKHKVKDEELTNVEITGFVSGENKIALFRKADIFIFLSEFEGMPNAVLEAMAFGLPIITTNVGGIASVFKDSVNGHLLDKVDIQDIVIKTNKILKEPEFYHYISHNNYHYARKNLWSDKVADRIIQIFHEVEKLR